MSNLVIVAIPAVDDYVHKISSEKVPHMTLLFLDEVSKIKNLSSILNFVGHASDRSLRRFGMDVDRRDILGEEEADVLFFSKTKWSGFETVNEFRSYLLKDNNIRTAYDSVEQFPEWIPHLTLGYPDTPAKPDERDYPGITYVQFDRIAVWFTEYDGIEFRLKEYEWTWDVAMSDTKGYVREVLAHHGVKGMRWGVRRKATVDAREVIVSDKRRKLKTSGGKGLPAHSDAVPARVVGQKIKKSGAKSVSDKELQDYARRIQLEQNVSRLMYNEKSRGERWLDGFLGRQGNQLANEAASRGGSDVGKRALKLAASAAA
jgi:hypothetical protein